MTTKTKTVKKTSVKVSVPEELKHLKSLISKNKDQWLDSFAEFEKNPTQENLNTLYSAVDSTVIDHCNDVLRRYINKNSIMSQSLNACGLRYNRNWVIKTCETLLLTGKTTKCNSSRMAICGKFCQGGQFNHSRKKFMVYKIMSSII